MEMQQLKDHIGQIENENSQRNLCLTLKKFLNFAGRKDLSDQIALAPMRISERKDKIDRITPEEVKKLLASEDNARNRALIAIFYESAGRLGEIIYHIQDREDKPVKLPHLH